MADSRLRFRVYIGGELADEHWLDALAPGAAGQMAAVRARHLALTEDAAEAGEPWLVEVFDPGEAGDRAYIRLGTDTEGMLDPLPLEDLEPPWWWDEDPGPYERPVQTVWLPGDEPPQEGTSAQDQAPAG